MGEKIIQLFSPQGMLFSDGAPLLVAEGTLFSAKRSGKKHVRLRLKNVSDKIISGVTVTVRGLDAEGAALWGDVVCPIDSLTVPRDGDFGQDKRFELLDGDVCSFAVSISEVAFEDGSTWAGSSEVWTSLTPAKTLEDSLGSDELANQFRIRYGTDCKYMPSDQRGIWFCACGGINRDGEAKCHLCRRTYAAQKAVNLGSLKADCAQRLKNEQTEHELERSLASDKKKKHLRRAVIIAPVALLLALIIAVLPSFIAGRKAYNAASALLSAGMYDEAAAAFEALGIYGDSREQAHQNVPYQKALYILDCAEEGNTPGLTLLGLRRSEFEDDQHMRMALYEGAEAIFLELGSYKDSVSKAKYTSEAYSTLAEQINAEDYDAAAALLAKGAYLSARDAFSALGDYDNSADMVLECGYQKALALLEYVEKRSVRGVRVRFSDTAGSPDEFQIPADALSRLGEAAVEELRFVLSGDGMTLSDDSAGMQPMCDALNALFISLGSYKDSPELAERANAAGDFTRPFFEYCSRGELGAAADWLKSYDGDFTDKEDWLNAIALYMPICSGWELHRGDSTLIPLTVGADEVCGSFTAAVLLDSQRAATLRISFGADGKVVELPAEAGSVKFVGASDGYNIYFAGINNVGHFTYIKYNGEGAVVSSVEYSRAAA